jgi:hypothetical protein
VCEVIEIDDVDIASDMERELNIRDGYGWNKSKDYRRVLTLVDKAKGLGAKVQIENKIGMFGYSIEERQKLNASIAHKGGNVTKERYSKPIDMFDYKTGKYICSFNSKSEASKELKLSNIGSVLKGTRNHSGGYCFKYKN